MAIKDWKKVKHWLYTDDDRVKAMWMYLPDGNLLTLQRKGKKYYIDYSGQRSILMLTNHHPQDPIMSYKKALKISKQFMEKN